MRAHFFGWANWTKKAGGCRWEPTNTEKKKKKVSSNNTRGLKIGFCSVGISNRTSTQTSSHRIAKDPKARGGRHQGDEQGSHRTAAENAVRIPTPPPTLPQVEAFQLGAKEETKKQDHKKKNPHKGESKVIGGRPGLTGKPHAPGYLQERGPEGARMGNR